MVVQNKIIERKHLKQEERVKISVWLDEKKWHRRIWRKLGRDHTVISREIKRNSVWCPRTWEMVYLPEQAERLRLERRFKANEKHIILLKSYRLREELEALLKEYWDSRGLDEILWRLKVEWHESINTSTVYRFIYDYKPCWRKYLRFWKHWYKKRGSWKKKTVLVWVPLIEERPESVDNREDIWDWEADMVVWPKWEKGWLVTLLERKSRYTLISKVPRATKDYVYASMYTMLCNEQVSTTTSDNGSEFASLALLWKKLWIPVYRCHPYASWEKWGNERNNGFIRRFCKKWLSIQQYSDEYIREVQDKLNHKPRKILWYKTPYEVYHNIEMKYLD